MNDHGPLPDWYLFRIMAGLIVRAEYTERGGGNNAREGEEYWAVKDHLEALDTDALRITLSRFMRETYLTEERLARGEGIADALRALDWLAEMGIDLSRTLPARSEQVYSLRLPS